MQLCWSKWAPLLGGIFCDDHTGLYTILGCPYFRGGSVDFLVEISLKGEFYKFTLCFPS